MSLKRHYETCDTTQHPRGIFGAWITVGTESNADSRTVAGDPNNALRGDYCSPLCLAQRIAKVDGPALRDAIMSEPTIIGGNPP